MDDLATLLPGRLHCIKCTRGIYMGACSALQDELKRAQRPGSIGTIPGDVLPFLSIIRARGGPETHMENWRVGCVPKIKDADGERCRQSHPSVCSPTYQYFQPSKLLMGWGGFADGAMDLPFPRLSVHASRLAFLHTPYVIPHYLNLDAGCFYHSRQCLAASPCVWSAVRNVFPHSARPIQTSNL